MEPFIVSARKYRPQSFEDVVGQEAITSTLENAIDANHLAQALLFCGPRGVGKTTCARILAKKINQDGNEREDEDFAFNIFELDAASNNSVDDIRNLTDQVRIPPQVGKYKVYIIDEVHMLSQSAFNAFLKTLEEPPKHAIFILATTEKHKIIPTILSRCQIFDFKRIGVKDIAGYLKYIAEQQEVEAEEGALHIIAQKADGAMRDALSIFDRVVSFSGDKLTRKAVAENLNVLDYETYFKATDLILTNNIPELLLLFNTVLSQGYDGHHFVTGLASHFRDLLVCKHEDTVALLEVSDQAKEQYLKQSRETPQNFLFKAIDLANECDINYKTSKNHRLLVELTLLKLASLQQGNEKKNPELRLQDKKQQISLIPPSHFINSHHETPLKQTIEIDTESIAEESREEEAIPEEETVIAEEIYDKNQDYEPTEPAVSETVAIRVKERKRVSGLSISSLKAKKEHQLNKIDVITDPEDLPKEEVTEAGLQEAWAQYVAKLDKTGRKIMASTLGIDIPRLLNGHTIWIQLPNSTMKKEIEREQSSLLEYLRDKLQNYDLVLKITINEEKNQQFAYTPEEKYEKLRAKNPAIDMLRKEFDLDL